MKISSGFSSEKRNQKGQIYGIWANDGNLGKPKYCLYVGKASLGEDIGDRFVQHARNDDWAPWWIGKGHDYSGKESTWLYTVRNLEFYDKYTKFDVAVAEQWWMQKIVELGGKLYNRINAISVAKFNKYKKDKKVWSSHAHEVYDVWKPKKL